MKKLFFLVALLMATGTVCAQYVHIEMNDGVSFDLDGKDIRNMVVDWEPLLLQSGDKVKGVVSLNGNTYTKTVGGTVGKPVDLGLPSGTLWADHNIGASNPEDCGAYLTWAEVGAAEEGYKNGVKDKYEWSNYRYCSNGKASGITKYTRDDKSTSCIWYENGIYVGDGKTELDPEDDAAYVNWGRAWKMPTTTQMEELVNKKYTEWSIVKVNNVVCHKVTSLMNGNSIYLPVAGYRYDARLISNAESSGYWSCSLGKKGYSYTAYQLYTSSANISLDRVGNYNSANSDLFYRYCGQSVRPVYVDKAVVTQE